MVFSIIAVHLNRIVSRIFSYPIKKIHKRSIQLTNKHLPYTFLYYQLLIFSLEPLNWYRTSIKTLFTRKAYLLACSPWWDISWGSQQWPSWRPQSWPPLPSSTALSRTYGQNNKEHSPPSSVVEPSRPEPDFLAGARTGEKGSGFWVVGTVVAK